MLNLLIVNNLIDLWQDGCCKSNFSCIDNIHIMNLSGHFEISIRFMLKYNAENTGNCYTQMYDFEVQF